jgi:hypothetical protein
MRIEIQPLAPCRKDTDYPAMPSKTFVLELPTGEGIAVQGATLVPPEGPCGAALAERTGGLIAYLQCRQTP